MQVGNGGLGALAESFEEALLEEHVTGRPARLTRGDGASGEIAVGDRAIDTDRAHRTSAGCQGHAERAENDESQAMHRSPSRTHARGPMTTTNAPTIPATTRRSGRTRS